MANEKHAAEERRGRRKAGAKGVSRREFIAGGVGATATALIAQGGPAAADVSTPIYRIHPAIGVARMGNADPNQFFIGPEIPGMGPTQPGSGWLGYKIGGLVRPQGARFRIFEYRWVGGMLTPIREVTLDTPGVAQIRWTAHVANRKGSFYGFYGPPGETSPAGPLRNASVADRSSLESDFGPRAISGPSATPVEFRLGGSGGSYPETAPRDPNGNAVIDYLGQLRTDDAGRLIVIGGQGKAASNTIPPAPLPTYANNSNWFDDASDGPITATVILSDGTEVPMDPAGDAWVLCAPPDFAPTVKNSVTMYDLLYDMAMRSMTLPTSNALYAPGGELARLAQLQADYNPTGMVEFPTIQPDFVTEIAPILRTAYEYFFVTHLVTFKHQSLNDPILADPSAAALKDRQGVFVYVRVPPGTPDNGSGPRTMPRLLGDSPYDGHANDGLRKHHLTRTQYGLMRNWANGSFIPPPGSVPTPNSITPHGLDRAALENCVGGAFFPGIEASWQIRNPALYIEPFRLNVRYGVSQYILPDGTVEGTPIRAGHFSRQGATPWHADFNDCRNEGDFGWWPGQRPDDVVLDPSEKRVPWARPDDRFPGGNLESTHADMVANWWKFGFVEETANGLIEQERNPSVP